MRQIEKLIPLLPYSKPRVGREKAAELVNPAAFSLLMPA